MNNYVNILVGTRGNSVCVSVLSVYVSVYLCLQKLLHLHGWTNFNTTWDLRSGRDFQVPFFNSLKKTHLDDAMYRQHFVKKIILHCHAQNFDILHTDSSLKSGTYIYSYTHLQTNLLKNNKNKTNYKKTKTKMKFINFGLLFNCKLIEQATVISCRMKPSFALTS